MTNDFEIVLEDDREVARISARGVDVLRNPSINAGEAFTTEQRKLLGLTGMLPPAVLTLDQQADRVYSLLQDEPTEMGKFRLLNKIQNTNEVLFYKVLVDHVAELLPIVYTPTIGKAIQEFNDWFIEPQGVFLDIDHPEDIEAALIASGRSADEIDIVVASDSEGILGIGDQGVDGIMISVGKIAVYAAAGGIHPSRCLPVVLDTGSNNEELRGHANYLGLPIDRVRDERYDRFIQAYVEAVTKVFPKAIVHWEDFAAGNAHRILEQYRDEYCSFNDDIQGTAAIVVSTVLSGLKTAGTNLVDQTFVIHGAGTAGIGIANLLVDLLVRAGLTEEEARKRFYGLNSGGLLVEDGKLRDFQVPYARTREEIADWRVADPEHISLTEVVKNSSPTILIGTSAQPGSFTQEIVEHLAITNERPIIMALSNPTSKCEFLPADAIKWTDGRALIATGSPFAPVEYNGVTYHIGQGNNALVFPGFALGVIASGATRITDGILATAAEAVADYVTDRSPGANLLPDTSELRPVSLVVAEKVVREAVDSGVATIGLDEALANVKRLMWTPRYPEVEAC